jgi:hypothetical protein
MGWLVRSSIRNAERKGLSSTRFPAFLLLLQVGYLVYQASPTYISTISFPAIPSSLVVPGSSQSPVGNKVVLVSADPEASKGKFALPGFHLESSYRV